MKKAIGFTLVELLVVLSVAAILLATGLPAMQEFVKNNRITTAANELVTALQLARTAAVQYGTRAQVCATKNQSGCTGSDWTQGWLVWADKNRNGALDSGEELQFFEAVHDKITITAPASAIRYDDRGAIAAGTGNFVICDDRKGETGRRITLHATGRTSLDRSYACS